MKTPAPLLQTPPLSLYIHIPWCIKKCPYCDFNSHTIEAIPEQRYVEALLRDLALETSLLEQRKLQSIFFGGGTPSLFSPDAIARILEGVAQQLDIDDSTEITLEANPGSLEADHFAHFSQAGINRLSLGVQSFNDKHLEALGRIHDSQAARKAVDKAMLAGFNSVNLDLMYGLPGQTLQQARADLSQALQSGVPHISWYQLTIEQNTVFYRSPPGGLPDDDQLFDFHTAGAELLAEQGFENYEISAHALEGHTCRHNLNYWQFGDYIGIGAGAHGKRTACDKGKIYRYQKTRRPEDYMSRFAAAGEGASATTEGGKKQHVVPIGELAFEYMMNLMRLDRTCSFRHFESHTGLPSSHILDKLEKLQAQGLLSVDNAGFSATSKGRLMLNDLLTVFL